MKQLNLEFQIKLQGVSKRVSLRGAQRRSNPNEIVYYGCQMGMNTHAVILSETKNLGEGVGKALHHPYILRCAQDDNRESG